MLVMFDFAVTQVRYIEAAMNNIASYRPDGNSPADVAAMLAAAAAVRLEYVVRLNAIQGQRALRRINIELAHDACVDFAGQGRSRYRKDPLILQRFDGLPVDDETFQQTITRCDAIMALWPHLPAVKKPDGTTGPFTFGQGEVDITLAAFTLTRGAATSANADIPTFDQAFQKAEGTMQKTTADLEDFAEAAISQGTQRYAEGSIEREMIDAIPGAPAQNPPGQAVISAVEVVSDAALRVLFDAPGGTTFDVNMRVFAEGVEFARIATGIIEREFIATGLLPGTTYEFIIIPHNSRGDGPLSNPATGTTAN